jgi:hypothetical protein
MPIEIRELVIRATVDPDGAGGCGAEAPASKGAQSQPRPEAGAADDLLQSCIREVLRVLAEKGER